MSKNILLPAVATIAIIGVGAAGGYLIDRHHRAETLTQTAAEETTAPQILTPPTRPPGKQALKRTPAVIATAPGTSMAMRAPTQPAQRPALTDHAMVAMSGTVVAKKGSVMTLKDTTGAVRVVVHEDTPKPWEVGTAVSAMAAIPVGSAVTVYGTVRDTGAVPKVAADAIYEPSSHTLYYVNADKQPPEQLNSQAFAARYTTVGEPANFTPRKVVATR